MRATILNLTDITPQICLLRPDALMPTQAHDIYTDRPDSGWDVYCPKDMEPIYLKQLERSTIPLGIAFLLPKPIEYYNQGELVYKRVYEFQARPRSGSASKLGVTIVNTPGTIDSGYIGELKAIIINLGAETLEITGGMKILQLVMNEVIVTRPFIPVDQLTSTTRGEKGLGSSGT